ncbi:MAG TPA: tetratricopeptide repeat protein [Myxococcales bacterium]|nr:tetratricopeptide repeat protein [Myxococcales bacterium]
MKKAHKFIFSIAIWLAFFVLLEGGLAILGVEPRMNTEDPYVGFASHIPLFVPDLDADGEAIWRTADNKRRFFNSQSFLNEKSVGTQRVFCLGGSTTYGRPYSDATSFCGWLREFLPVAAPNSSWEVVNAGGISYASYRVAALTQELVDHEPDFFVIYTGHNEFLEDRTYGELRDRNPILKRVDSLLRSTRIDAALRDVLETRRNSDQPVILRGEVSAVLDGSIGPSAYERNDVLRDQVLAHYRYNLDRIIRLARSSGAEPILVVPASNLRACSPFRSTHFEGLTQLEIQRWEEAMDAGRIAVSEGDLSRAAQAFAEATVLDPRRADSHYKFGQVMLQLGQSEQAEASLRRALDEDVCPLRALSPVASIVREVAREKDVLIVDFETLVETRVIAEKGHGAPGDDWFLDHVHPTIEGHRFLALEIIRALGGAGWIPAEGTITAKEEESVTRAVLESVDQRTHGMALRNLAKVLSWAGKTEDAGRLAQKASDYLDDDANLDFILGTHAAEAGNLEEALLHYRQALARDPGYTKALNNLGTTLAGLGRDTEAIEAYREALSIAPQHTGARFNLANALLRQGKTQLAIDHYQWVLRDDPEDIDARFNLARTYQRAGDPEQARAEFRKILELAPEDIQALRALEELSSSN